MRYDKLDILLFILGTIALLIVVAFVLSSERNIITNIPDDSFYYFQIASNFISGKGSSLDGIRTTNGYHPLWMIVISPLFLLKEYDMMLPVRLVIILAGLLTIATAYVLYNITMIITQRKILSIFAFGAYIFSSNSFFSNISGEPVPLSNLLIVIGLLITLKAAFDENLSWRGASLFGVISGLTVLARTDNIVFVFTYFILILMWYRKEKRFIKVSIAGLITLFIISPWFIWSLTALGTIKQTSADACAYLYRVKFLNNAHNFVDIYYTSLKNLLYPASLLQIFGFSPFYFTLLFLIGSLFGVFKTEDNKLRRSIIISLSMVGVLFILYIVHTGIAFYIRFWHVASFAIFTVLIIVSFIHIYFKSGINIKRFLILLSILYFFIFVRHLYLRNVEPPYMNQLDMYKSADYINNDLNHLYSVYDGGIISYFTDGRILSIDGNVNPEAYIAVKERRVYDYMVKSNAYYFIGLIESNKSLYEPF
ncbi:MAG: hypothetical protein ACUVWP_05580 [bacterium]